MNKIIAINIKTKCKYIKINDTKKILIKLVNVIFSLKNISYIKLQSKTNTKNCADSLVVIEEKIIDDGKKLNSANTRI